MKKFAFIAILIALVFASCKDKKETGTDAGSAGAVPSASASAGAAGTSGSANTAGSAAAPISSELDSGN
jgi:hypothetical protein